MAHLYVRQFGIEEDDLATHTAHEIAACTVAQRQDALHLQRILLRALIDLSQVLIERDGCSPDHALEQAQGLMAKQAGTPLSSNDLSELIDALQIELD